MSEISLQHVVKAPHLKHVWIPDCKTIGGYVFARLCKWDRGWVRFLNEQALNFADRNTFANSSFLDSLRRLRNNVYDAALKDMHSMEEVPITTITRSNKESEGLLRAGKPALRMMQCYRHSLRLRCRL